MSYLLKMLLIMTSLLVMSGCGLQQYTKSTSVAGYPYRYADFDYKYAWQTTATDHGIAIDGAMKNVRYAYIDSSLITVTALDKDGRTITSASDFPTPQQSREGEVCAFNLLLRDFRPAESDVLHFQIHYSGNEGHGGIDWHSSFKVDAQRGTVIHPPRKNPDEW